MKKLSLVFLILFMNNKAVCAESFMNIGTSAYDSNQATMLSIGYKNKVFSLSPLSFINWKGETGFWMYTENYKTPTCGFGSLQIGADIQSSLFTASTFHGIGGISRTDYRLGSNFQFFHDVCMGLKDDVTSSTLSFCYKHISNASISLPNLGRDFMTIKIGVPY